MELFVRHQKYNYMQLYNIIININLYFVDIVIGWEITSIDVFEGMEFQICARVVENNVTFESISARCSSPNGMEGIALQSDVEFLKID